MSFFAFLVAFPFLWMILSSFKDGSEVFAKGSIFPKVWNFSNYAAGLAMAPFDIFIKNSIIVAAIAIVAQVITCSLAAYGFAKVQFRSKKIIFAVLLASMMIPTESTIVANFLTLKSLNLINTYLGISITSLTSFFGIFLMRQFFLTIPNSLNEAAYIDGCNEFTIFLRIYLPLSKGSLATVAIFAFINSWNSFMWPLTVTSKTEMRTVQVGLRYLVDPDLGTQWPQLMAVSTVIILPVLLVFLFLQKYFIQGITKTGVK